MAAQISLLINAGGRSRRMGEPKALLPVPPHGQPLLTTIVQRLQALAPDAIVVIANDPQIRERAKLGATVRWLVDREEEVGPLGGIATGLDALTGWVICVASDMPLLNPALFTALLALARETDETGNDRWDAIVPLVDGYPEPMHALYHCRCLPAVEASLARGTYRATAFLAAIRVRYVEEAALRAVDPDLHSFLNANTPDEWAKICTLILNHRAAT